MVEEKAPVPESSGTFEPMTHAPENRFPMASAVHAL